MKSTMTIDASNFAAMAKDLAYRLRASGVTLPNVIDSEAGAVISTAAKRTREAKIQTIKRNIRQSIPSPNDNIQRKNTFYTPPGGGPVKRGWKIPDARWNAYLASRSREEVKRLASRGLARQAWLQIGDSLRLSMREQGLAQARRAVSVSGRRIRHRANGVRSSQPEKYTIIIQYANPLGRYAGARSALMRAINGRVGFFNRNLRSGVFSQASQVAAKYPGLKITP